MALSASGAAVLVALLVLMVKVRAAPEEPALAPDELARAVSAGQARQTAAPSLAPPMPSPLRPPPRSPRPEPSAPEPSAPQNEAASAPEPSAAASEPEPSAAAPQLPAAAPPNPAGAAEPAADDQRSSALEIANEYYERGDYDKARSSAVAALELGLDPQATDKMHRIGAAASCFMGEPERARVHYDQLEPRSQRDIARRCRRMGIEF